MKLGEVLKLCGIIVCNNQVKDKLQQSLAKPLPSLTTGNVLSQACGISKSNTSYLFAHIIKIWYLADMKKITIPDAERVVLAIQDEIRRSPESRFDHRLHGILLIAQGNSGREVARLLGVAPRTVAYWVRRFEQGGLWPGSWGGSDPGVHGG